MKHFKHLCMLLAAMLLSINVWGETIDVISTLNRTSSLTLSASATTINSVLSVSGTKGTSNFPAFNYNATNGTDLRFYKGTTCAVTFTAADGYQIDRVEFKKNSTTKSTLSNISADKGSLADNIWTASSSTSSVKFTYNNSSSNFNGQIYIINITYSSTSGSNQPTVSAVQMPTACEFVGSKSIELSCTTEGATIYYTTNGDDPTTSSTQYNGAFTITETKTVKAIAVKDATNSSVSSATYTKVTALTTMDEIFAAATTAGSTATSKFITFNNWVISGVKNSNAYLTDNNGKGLIIYQSGHGFVAGDILSGTATCKVQLYNGSAELTVLSTTTDGLSVNKGGIVTPIENASIASLGGVNTGAIYSFSELTYDGSVFSDGENTIKPYNTFITLPTLITDKKYNVKGMYLQYNTTKEIAPRSESDIELATNVTLSSIAISGTATKTNYFVGNAFDPAGLIATATYSDASTLDVTSSAEWSFDPATLALGTTTVNVTATFNEVSSEALPVSVTVSTLPVWATTYTSNVTLTANADTKANKEKVKVNGESTEYDVLKCGTSSVAGSCTVTAPLGTTKLHFHAILWSNTTGNLVVKQDETELFNQAISANSGLANSSTYTLAGNPTDDYYCIDFGSALTEAITLTFSCTNKRFAIYGVNAEKVDIELLSVAISGTATNTEYFAGDVFDPAGLVVTGTYNIGEPQEITEGIDWTFTPATLSIGTTSVSVVATVGEKSSEAFVVNDLTVTAAPVHADWVANAQGYADATAVVGSAIKHETTTVATVTFDKAEGSNDPKYYDNGEAVRAYAKNTFVVSALKGFTMTKIVLAFGASDGSNAITADGGTYADGEWTGEATEVTFTIGGSTGNRRIAGLTIYYEGELATPTGIVLNTETVKKEFAFGEEFNSDNLKVEAVYSDESKEDVTLAATVVAPDMSTAGEKTVTVNYQALSATYTITVAEPIAATSIELDETSISVRVDKTAKLTATVLPAEAVDKAVTWVSSDEEIVIVDQEGNITPVAVGNATITVKMTNNAAVFAECAVEVTAAPVTKNYYLVKDVNVLMPGDVIILGCAAKNMVAGEIADGKDFLQDMDATFANGIATATEALEFTLGKDGNNWTLTSTQGKLGATTAKKMTTDESKNNYVGTWTIAITEAGVATITSTGSNYGAIKYNATSPRFLNYASGQTEIEIYCTVKRESATLRENLTAGTIGTYCADKNVDYYEGATFYVPEYKNVSGGVATSVYFVEAKTLEAGHAYIYIAEATEITAIVSGEAATVAVSGEPMVGTLAEGGTTPSIPAENTIYIVYNNELRPVATSANLHVGKGKAYLNMSLLTSEEPAPAPGRKRISMGVTGANTATGLNNIEAAKVQKVLVNGAIYILRGEKMYNVNGQLVK